MFIPVIGSKNHKFKINVSEQNEGAGRLALLLPGVGYRLKNPIFYFIHQLLLDRGYRVASANYTYDKVEGFRDLAFEEVMSILQDDATTIAKKIEQLPKHRELLVVGKSLGTALMGNMLAQGYLPNANLAWLTPSANVPTVHQTMLKHAQKSFICIGTADKGYDNSKFEGFKQAGATVSLIKDLAHVLECEKDVPKSIMGHHKMIVDFQSWLQAVPNVSN